MLRLRRLGVARLGAVALVAAALVHSVPVRAQARLDAVALPEVGPGQVALLSADLLTWDRTHQVVTATGEVRLVLGKAVLTAPVLVYDQGTRIVRFGHGVKIVDGARTVTAEHLRLHLGTPEAVADQVDLLVASPKRHLHLTAVRLARDGARHFQADQVAVTACACGGGHAPSWRLTAKHASIAQGQGAWLYWTMLEVKNVPVLPLPILYLPLGPRRSGLLAPGFGWSGRSGFHLDEPVYLTLGRSFDLTFTPGWYSGVGAGSVQGTSGRPVRPGVKGFTGALELRYAPWRRTRGRVALSGIYDTQVEDYLHPATSHARGLRLRLRWLDHSRFDRGGFGVAGSGFDANVDLVSDAAYISDLAVRLASRERGYLRSSARLHATAGDHLGLELGGVWLQDLRLPTMVVNGLSVKRPLFGSTAQGVPFIFQQLPTAHATLMPVPLGLGLFADGALHGIWWQPTGAAFDDAGADGLLPGDLGYCVPGSAGCDSAGEGNGRLDPGEQGPVLHGRLAADVSRPFHAGNVLAGRVRLGLRGDAWLDPAVGGAPTRSATRLYPLIDVRLHTGLTRRFGALVHRIEPFVAWRYVPRVLQAGPIPSLDAFDNAVFAAGLDQLEVGADSRLTWHGQAVVVARLVQAVDLAGGTVGQTELTAHLRHPDGHTLEGTLAWDWHREVVTYGLLQLVFKGPGGAAASARLLYVDPQGSQFLRAGLDELFATGAVPPPPLADARLGGVPVSVLDLGVNAPFPSGWRVRLALELDTSASKLVRAPQPAVGIAYASPCKCWGFGVTAVWPSGQVSPELAFSLSLAGLGSVSSSTNP